MSTYKIEQCPVFEEWGGITVTSPFAPRTDPISGRENTPHNGVDIVLYKGWNTTAYITAFAGGTVIAVKNSVPGKDTVNKNNSAGNYVTIDHGNGYVTKYFHLKYDTICVAKGDRVAARQRIGYMGTTGYSSGAHLHFQIEKDGTPIDGLPYLLGEKSIAAPAADPATTPETTTAVQDNEPQPWARDAIEWAQANGIVFGDENGNLMLREPCTREQMLVFIHRALKSIGAIGG